jgi:two-component system CheB/CheR fusion protein
MAGKKKSPSNSKVKKAAGKIPTTKKRKGDLKLSQKNRENPYIVGIGASAGGLEAFQSLFQNMPKENGMSFVLVPHLDPTHVSMMPELLQKNSQMPVREISDGMVVEPDTVYIVPSGKNLALLHGTLQLLDTTEEPSSRLPIDYFLRTLAQDAGEQAIAVILSGMGSDGTMGIRAVKGELGMTMVQDPHTAKYDGMPNSAVATGLVDYVLSPDKMGPQLVKYIQHVEQKILPAILPADGQPPFAMQKIFILLRSHTGHDFSFYKPTTISRHIERRMNVHQVDRVIDYVRLLQQNSQEVTLLFKELLIGVTNFFRDSEAFETLKKKCLMNLIADKSNNGSLRMWVPGCSTGEEAYSMAIMVQECLEEIGINLGVQVFATDIDTDAIEVARSGEYPASIAADVSQERLKRFFSKEGATYRIHKNIREMLVFAPQDIIRDPPFTKLDLISCRNLLIYLEAVIQKKLLPLFHYALNPGGMLFLGTSETIGNFIDLFKVENKKWKIFRRKHTAAAYHTAVEFPFPSKLESGRDTDTDRPQELNLSRMTEKILLENYAPPSVIINEKGGILFVHGRTGVFLEPAPGEASLNLMEMAREGFKPELHFAVRQALTQKSDVVRQDLKVKDNGGWRRFDLIVKPLNLTDSSVGMLLVVFEERSSATAVKKITPAKKVAGKKSLKPIEVLEEELRYTRENLQITIEELETSNEELKSTNEELQSTNEELQSANEELETSKEEQQSLNEELVTVNTELNQKIDAFTLANNDMRNLLDSIEVPTVFLDDQMRIKRFTANVTKVINVIDTDIGRPLRHLAFRFKYDQLVADARNVLKTLVYREVEIQTEKGHWYLMRILPYRTIDNIIDGVVIIFLDIHGQKVAGGKIDDLNQALEEQCAYAERIIETLREPMLVLDSKLNIVSTNPAFYAKFQVSSGTIAGRNIFELQNRQWEIPSLKKLLEKVVVEAMVMEDFPVEHTFEKIGKKKMLLNARKIERGTGKENLILLAFEDVTN